VTVIATWPFLRSVFAVGAGTDPDGMPTWPIAYVRASGFSGTITGIGRPIQAFPLTVTCNGGLTDVADSSSFSWYFSQRTDNTAAQYLAITHGDATKTGTVTVALTAKCVADLGLGSATDSLTEDQLVRILNNVHLYVKRHSDDAIQWLDVLEYTLGAA
jgi:hypothetical protein